MEKKKKRIHFSVISLWEYERNCHHLIVPVPLFTRLAVNRKRVKKKKIEVNGSA